MNVCDCEAFAGRILVGRRVPEGRLVPAGARTGGIVERVIGLKPYMILRMGIIDHSQVFNRPGGGMLRPLRHCDADAGTVNLPHPGK